MIIVSWKKLMQKGYAIYYMVLTLWYSWKRKKYRDNRKTSVCQGGYGGGRGG
jgi:hypothetical protein